MITIRRAVYDDIPGIMRFIDEHYKKDHILARDRVFFEWQYVDESGVNVYLGIDDETEIIYGMEGVIKYNHSMAPDVSGSIWKTIKSENPMLGQEIEQYLVKDLNVRYGCSAGMSDKALKIYELMGMETVQMDHYYRMGDWDDYKIAKIEEKVILPYGGEQLRLVPIHSIREMKEVVSEESLFQNVMSKDYDYIKKRYFEHPRFKYEIWKSVDVTGKSDLIVITRDEKWNDRKICKIIDLYGNIDQFSKITQEIDKLIREREYEFIDIYSFGVPSDIYKKVGFVSCTKESKNIIPNYFNPFEQRNVELKMVNPMAEGLRLFRGDGDQDRPC